MGNTQPSLHIRGPGAMVRKKTIGGAKKKFLENKKKGGRGLFREMEKGGLLTRKKCGKKGNRPGVHHCTCGVGFHGGFFRREERNKSAKKLRGHRSEANWSLVK